MEYIPIYKKEVKKKRIKPVQFKLKRNDKAKYNGFSFLVFIWVREQQKTAQQKTKIHESIHFYQNVELLFIGFYLLYTLFYVFNLIKYRNRYKAYREIPFEREAFANQMRPDYNKTRKLYSWIKYITK